MPDGPARHLWLLRHGKAATEAPRGGRDQERPLTGRGRRDATALGDRLAHEDPVLGLEGVPRPELVMCSAAARTRQTADLIVRAAGNRLPLDSFSSLYGADTDLVLGYVREIDEQVTSALVVGHNPTMYQLVWELLSDRGDEGPGSDRAALDAHGFPTCSLAVLVLEVRAWEDVAHGCGRLAGLFKPPY